MNSTAGLLSAGDVYDDIDLRPDTTTHGGPAMPADTGSASTGFIVWAAALVFVMTPGLALFYSGLSRYNSALSLMMLCMMAMAVVSVQWFLFGFSLAFAEHGSPFIGDFTMGAVNTLDTHAFPNTAPQIPSILFMVYQMQFAGITAALVFGSVPERTRFVPAMVFVFFWTTLVYDFAAYWTWADHGFLRNLNCVGAPNYDVAPCYVGAYDFAGGGPVHICAGFSGLAYLVVLGKRKLIHAEHHNMVNVMFGTGILWFGWFAFNGGSAGAANTRAAMAATVTTLAAATGGLTWVFVDWIGSRKMSAFSFCSGVVAGLVAITPASGYVAPWAAIVIGILVAIICNGCCRLKKRLGIDDSFDAGSLHGCGGFVGNLFTGIFAQKWVAKLDGTDIAGGLIEGNWLQIFFQLVASAVIAVWAFCVSYLILFIINKIPGLHLRQSEADEALGGDMAEMGEAGYMLEAESASKLEKLTAAKPVPRITNLVNPMGSKRFDAHLE
ncbi:Ammonium transporter 1 [Hypsibius exemplaris]|uniref:Ammonium transporter n=1 Tax=Hypsibius exemplaris TaxID=2072580 RepID=A0A1W0X2V9_HYPEX|nr:Ammonium transporter 1 [Hypsibius exemplaris]